jgi:glycogen synthase
MRILMLSWEYPPLVAGGHGRHAAVVARRLVGLGHEVHVVTRLAAEVHHPVDEWMDGVHVIRVTEAPPVIPLTDRVPAVLSFNSRAQAVAGRLVRELDIDVLHVHDRLLAYAASGLRDAFGLPIVATIHATEYTLHPGLPDEVSKLVHQVEWWLTYEARRVITCTEEVRGQLLAHFRLPADKLDVIPAAVDVPPALPDAEVRGSLAGPRTRIVLVGGRLDPQGLDVLLGALPAVREAAGPTRLVVSAAGVDAAEIRRLARRAGARHHVLAVQPDGGEAFARQAAVADAVVILGDEPCGESVVEAMACGAPVVVGGDPGLAEIVEGVGKVLRRPTARTAASALIAVLTDDERTSRLRALAQERAAERHEGAVVAADTVAVYERAIAQERDLAADERRPPLRPILQAAPILELDGTA